MSKLALAAGDSIIDDACIVNDEQEGLRMNSPQFRTHQHYTAADYAAWNDGQRYELLHGCLNPYPPRQTFAISLFLAI